MVYSQKLCSVCLVMALLFGLSACQSPEPDLSPAGSAGHQERPTMTTGAAAADDAQGQIPPIPALDELSGEIPANSSDWIFTSYQQTISWRDQAGNYCAMTLSLPALVPAAEFALDFNRQMLKLGQSLLQEASECQYWGYSPSTNYLSYEVLAREPLTFLVISQHYADGYTQKQVFAFDFADLRSLPLGQVTEALTGMNYPAFLQAAGQAVANHFAEQYGDFIADLERQAQPSSLDFHGTEPDPRIAVYHRTLEQLPYSAFHIAQYCLIPDEAGGLLLSCPMPTLDEGISVPAVIPFDPEALDWQAPTDAAAYGKLFDLQHYVTEDHAVAYWQMLLAAYFSDSAAFTEFAARESADSAAILCGSIALAADEQQKAGLTAICQELALTGELTSTEALFNNSLLAALQ